MKTSTIYPILFFIFCCSIISCQKIELQPLQKNGNGLTEKTLNSSGINPFKLTSAPFIGHDDDSIERPTTLGMRLTNPYLVPNMQQAYFNLGLSSSMATVNNLYVRFLPSGIDQLTILDSTMVAQGLELFDTPVDYDVTYEGDYYQDPSIPEEQITWQYAVVPPNFQFPAGIQYETIAQIHVPGDDYTAVETEAERLASIQDGVSMSMNGNVQPNLPYCGPGYHWDFETRSCVACPDGYQWDGTRCVLICPPGYHEYGGTCVPNQTFPPPPAPDAAVPAGNIYVHDTNLNSFVPVRKARMVARRWFKIERTYTDNNGHSVFTKRFKNKVRINVKFKNEDAQIRNVRGIRFWQMAFAVKKTLGIVSGDKTAIDFTFVKEPDYSAKGNMYWTAATTHNAVQEYRDYAPQEGIGLPSQGLKIFVSRLAGSGGATPMFAKRQSFSLSTQFVLTKISGIASIVNNIIAIIKGQIDMVIGYKYGNISLLLSDQLKTTVYHELTHAAHYAALGNSWYTTFVTAEETEIVSNFSSGYSPYGDGTNSSSPIVALGEGWAYYMGHYLADKRYGTAASCQVEQDGGINWCNGTIGGTGHPHLDVEENFNPNLTIDRFEWIPQGLFYDLMDPANETVIAGRPINDNVSGYSNTQMFSAF